MRYQEFRITNYKGIQDLTFALESEPTGPVYTLVGLNESGKTTILEALSLLYENVGDGKEITSPNDQEIDDYHELIPRSQQANFTGHIKLEAKLLIEENDKLAIEQLLKKSNHKLESISNQVEIKHQYSFLNSKYSSNSSSRVVVFSIFVRPKGKKKAAALKSVDEESWGAVRSLIIKRVPPVIYYPNFLFDFPDKIYLEAIEGETQAQPFYRRFLQDVLDSLPGSLSLSTHVLQRIKSSSDADKASLESTLNYMAAQMNKAVFAQSSDLRLFKVKNRQFVINHGIDSTGPYLAISLKEGFDTYRLRERSLGFRWFLTFALFTQFRIQRKSASTPVFLLDEPASNLNQTAQQKLVGALGELTKDAKSIVVYSTHSHHLIKPTWLENTFVVINEGIDYENEDDFASPKTNIKMERYRSFVANHPNQQSYYQVVLDVLDYRPSELELVPSVVMTEGKGDFYLLRYMQDIILSGRYNVSVVPGGGAGNLDSAIQLYLGWSRELIILLDGDTEGIKQKKRYINMFGKALESKIFLLSDVDKSWSKFKIENLLDNQDKLLIQKTKYPQANKFNKKFLHFAIQEMLLNQQIVSISQESVLRFEQLLNFLQDKLSKK